MPQRTLILSDLHLGRSRAGAISAEALRPLWQGCDCVILNGDTADLSHPALSRIAQAALDKLLELCADDGAEVIALAGNHDPAIDDRRCHFLNGEEVFMTHGDVFHPAVTPWGPIGNELRAHRECVLADLLRNDSMSPLEAELIASREASGLEWERRCSSTTARYRSMIKRAIGLIGVPYYWRIFPKLAAKFVDRHDIGSRFVVFGHTHRSGIWHIDDRVIINTGCFGFPGQTRAVVLDGNELSVFNVRMSNRTYTLASQPCASFELMCSRGQEEPSHVAPEDAAANTREASDRPVAAAM